MMVDISTRWTTYETKNMKLKFVGYSKNTTVCGSHSNIPTPSKGNYLPGRTLSLFFENLHLHIEIYRINKDILGRLSAVTVKRNKTSLLFITVYRIIDYIDPGHYTFCNKYNKKWIQ